MKVFTAQQMRDFDRAAIEDYGIPSIVLMENAALRVVEFLEAKFAPLSEKKIVILCGKGNNGGDGLAIARHLINLRCRVLLLHPNPEELKGDALAQWKMLTQNSGANPWEGAMSEFVDWSQLDLRLPEEISEDAVAASDYAQLSDQCARCDIAVDALLGTGLSEPMRAPYPQLIGLINGILDNVCIDIFSGFDADTGEFHADELPFSRARYTVTLAAPKSGLFLRDALNYSGEVWVGGIGARWGQSGATRTGAQTLDRFMARAWSIMLGRNADAHKGDAGRALIVGGALGMSGSICLAAKAALATGAGLVAAAIPEKVLPIFAASVLEAVAHPLPNDESGHLTSHGADDVAALWEQVQVVALGPGLGRTDEAFEFARRVVRDCPVPLVIDADALHALPAIADDVKAREQPTILTPHPGEMGVLMDSDAKTVNDARFETVAACARKYGAIVVLKGARSLVCDSAGEIWVNLTGNAGMATGGAGDVLTGTIAGLLAQLKDADKATQLGVYVHGLAGDIAFKSRGNGLVAGDIVADLPAALLEIKTGQAEQINGRLRKLE